MHENSVKEFFLTRNSFNIEDDFEKAKDKILGLTYRDNEGERVCDEFWGLSKSTVDKKETEKKTLQ